MCKKKEREREREIWVSFTHLRCAKTHHQLLDKKLKKPHRLPSRQLERAASRAGNLAQPQSLVPAFPLPTTHPLIHTHTCVSSGHCLAATAPSSPYIISVMSIQLVVLRCRFCYCNSKRGRELEQGVGRGRESKKICGIVCAEYQVCWLIKYCSEVLQVLHAKRNSKSS